jgi:RHS repeat-associated protein
LLKIQTFFHKKARTLRIAKKINFISGESQTNYYLRDAQGNIMANYLYRDITTDDFILAGHEIYGSSRVGTTNANKTLWTAQEGILTDQANHHTFTRGAKSYELSNHLGNVLAVISDRKLAVDANNNDTTDYYTADVQSRQMYYSFGMIQPNTQNLSGNYKYGAGGMMMDSEISGTGNSYTTYFRQYDPRLGRWKSIDPVVHPYQSSYAAFNNNPIFFIDPSGAKGSGFLAKAGEKIKEVWNKITGKEGGLKEVGEPNITEGTYRLDEVEISYCKSCETTSGGGSSGGFLSKIENWLNTIDNFLKTGFPDWAYSDLRGTSRNDELSGNGDKGNFGGFDYNIKGGGQGQAIGNHSGQAR